MLVIQVSTGIVALLSTMPEEKAPVAPFLLGGGYALPNLRFRAICHTSKHNVQLTSSETVLCAYKAQFRPAYASSVVSGSRYTVRCAA